LLPSSEPNPEPTLVVGSFVFTTALCSNLYMNSSRTLLETVPSVLTQFGLLLNLNGILPPKPPPEAIERMQEESEKAQRERKERGKRWAEVIAREKGQREKPSLLRRLVTSLQRFVRGA